MNERFLLAFLLLLLLLSIGSSLFLLAPADVFPSVASSLFLLAPAAVLPPVANALSLLPWSLSLLLIFEYYKFDWMNI